MATRRGHLPPPWGSPTMNPSTPTTELHVHQPPRRCPASRHGRVRRPNRWTAHVGYADAAPPAIAAMSASSNGACSGTRSQRGGASRRSQALRLELDVGAVHRAQQVDDRDGRTPRRW